MFDPNALKRDEITTRGNGLIQSEQFIWQNQGGSKLVRDFHHLCGRRFLTASWICLAALLIVSGLERSLKSQVVQHRSGRFARADYFPDQSCEPSFQGGNYSDYDYSLGLWQNYCYERKVRVPGGGKRHPRLLNHLSRQHRCQADSDCGAADCSSRDRSTSSTVIVSPRVTAPPQVTAPPRVSRPAVTPQPKTVTPKQVDRERQVPKAVVIEPPKAPPLTAPIAPRQSLPSDLKDAEPTVSKDAEPTVSKDAEPTVLKDAEPVESVEPKIPPEPGAIPHLPPVKKLPKNNVPLLPTSMRLQRNLDPEPLTRAATTPPTLYTWQRKPQEPPVPTIVRGVSFESVQDAGTTRLIQELSQRGHRDRMSR